MSPTLRVSRKALHALLACLPFLGSTGAALAAPTSPEGSDSAQHTIGFSNLVLRPGDKSRFATANDELRVRLIEHLRSRGLNAVGAESLVFGKDRSSEAELLLGGTVSELDCVERRAGGAVDCLVGVDWELLDTSRDAVVYRLRAYHAVKGATAKSSDTIAETLLFGALDSLLRRPHFRAMLREEPAPAGRPSSYDNATFPTCSAPERALPAQAEQALDSVVIVETEHGFGSGFFFSEAPLVLTAAHVAKDGALRVKLRNGQESAATVVRLDEKADVALLRLTEMISRPACTPLFVDASPAVGTPIYVMGSPAAKQLAFSLTQGIVSSVRIVDGAPLIQTDAPINPGNSGGPLVDAKGRAVAIASFKLSGISVEGVGFGVPVPHALERLGLSLGLDLSPSLLQGVATAPTSNAPTVFTDTPDPRPELDPTALEARRKSKDRTLQRRPGYVGFLRWGGLAAGGVGALLIGTSWSRADSESLTTSEWETLRLENDVGWVALAVGATAFTLSFPLDPIADEDESSEELARRTRHTARAELGVAPGRFDLKMSF